MNYLAIITVRKSFVYFGLYFVKSEKRRMLFISQGASVLGETVPSVLSPALGGTQDRGRKHRES